MKGGDERCNSIEINEMVWVRFMETNAITYD